MKQQLALLGQKVPDLSLVITGNKTIDFQQLRGKNLVLYFYPKDDTSGCTLEGQEFTALYSEFSKLNTCIFGVSRDSLKSHEKFKCKYTFPFELVSDENQALCHYFDVLKEKSLYGKKYIGIDRSTFLIDFDGIIRQEWRNVKAPGHAAEVLVATKQLGK